MSAESNELSSLKSNCAKKPIKKWKLIAAIAVLAIFNVCWGTGESLAVGLLTKYRTKYKTQKWQDKNDKTKMTPLTKNPKAPLLPLEASERGASGSEISPG